MIPLLWLNLAESGEVCGTLITEDGDQIVTEAGDALVTECFTPEESALVPGRVIKGAYPYWRPRKKPVYVAPFTPKQPDFVDEEEFLILTGIDLD